MDDISNRRIRDKALDKYTPTVLQPSDIELYATVDLSRLTTAQRDGDACWGGRWDKKGKSKRLRQLSVDATDDGPKLIWQRQIKGTFRSSRTTKKEAYICHIDACEGGEWGTMEQPATCDYLNMTRAKYQQNDTVFAVWVSNSPIWEKASAKLTRTCTTSRGSATRVLLIACDSRQKKDLWLRELTRLLIFLRG
jgi:hypothetical protein